MKQVLAKVHVLEPVGSYLRLVLTAPEVSHDIVPGHFVGVRVGDQGSGMLLRRAFSIHQVNKGQGIEIIFAAKGQGTQWLRDVKVGDEIDIVAPLGTPFSLPTKPTGVVLVAGGYGAAPMGMLARALVAMGCQVEVVLGAATADKLFGVDDLKRDAGQVTVTTDDGSAGVKGRVSDVLADLMARVDATVIYACGPMPMLEAVARIATEHGATSQCAVEESMACGIGVCMTCVLPVIGDDGITRMVRSCVEGPVFDGSKVRWGDVHTVPSDVFGAPVSGGH